MSDKSGILKTKMKNVDKIYITNYIFNRINTAICSIKMYCVSVEKSVLLLLH